MNRSPYAFAISVQIPSQKLTPHRTGHRCRSRRPTLLHASACAHSVATHAWMRDVVVALNLCPFAAAPLDEERVRVAVHPDAKDERTVRGIVTDEIDMLLSRPATEVETTVVVLPSFATSNFVRWNALCTQLEDELNTSDGDVMVACFHPLHMWGGMHPRSAAHFDRRAPYPVINILRSASIDHVVRDGLDVGIAARNLETLEKHGFDELERRMQLTAEASGVE